MVRAPEEWHLPEHVFEKIRVIYEAVIGEGARHRPYRSCNCITPTPPTHRAEAARTGNLEVVGS